MRRSLLFLVSVAVIALHGGGQPVVAAPGDTQNVASESYYVFDTEKGEIEVTVRATIQAARVDLQSVFLWAMPSGVDVVVSRGGTILQTVTVPDKTFGAARVTATLDRTLKAKARSDFEMTYRIPGGESRWSIISKGLIATGLVSQGDGSFVFVDLPVKGENFLDPGCLKVANQPGDVAARGFERWVCGEIALIALNSDDPSIIRQCSNLEDRCRQRLIDAPISAYAQSATDDSKTGTLVTDVAMDRGPVRLTFKYFNRDREWAARQFQIAQQALPLLEDVFAFPYPGESLVLRESYQLNVLGFAGLAFPTLGEALLAADTGMDDEVTIHELSHQWAGFNLATSWLWEGLAEWSTTIVAGQMGVPLYKRPWDQKGYADPLAMWFNGSKIQDPDYWYGKAEAFWTAYEQTIGGRGAMTSVLSRLNTDSVDRPLDGQWFMNRGEEVSGANLDTLFLTWVFNPVTAPPLLADRREAMNRVASLREKAAVVGLSGTPTDILSNLEEWYFSPVAGQVREGEAIVAEYAELLEEMVRAGFTPPTVVPETWGSRPLAETRARVRDQRKAFEALLGARIRLAEEPVPSDQAKLDEAMVAFAAGEFTTATQLAAAAATRAVTGDTAVKLIELAREKRDGFHPNFFQKLGMIGKSPDKDLAAAEEALAAGDTSTALQRAQAAYDGWHGAQSRGFLWAAILTGVTCAVTLVAAWLIRRVDGKDEKELVARRHWSGFEIRELSDGDLGGGDAQEPGSFWRGLDNR